MGERRVSVVVPTFNRLAQLQRTLDGLAAQVGLDGELEVVVVSDGSTDGTEEYLASGSPPLPLVVGTQPNSGPAVARNHGIALATGDYVLFIDDDVVPAPELVAAHLRRHAAEEGHAVVIGPMLTPMEEPLSAWVRWEQYMLYKQYAALERGDYEPTARQFYTGNASVARRHLDAVGGFDPSFRRAEDVELAYRLADRGLTFTFAPEAVVVHHAERSYDAWRRAATAYGRNDVIFSRDHGRGWLLDSICLEFNDRHRLVRGLTKACLPHRRTSVVVDRSLSLLVRASDRVGADRISRAALSAVYNLAYYRGMADELGDPQLLLARFDAARPDVDVEASTQRHVLLTVSGTIDGDVEQQIAAGRRPRADYLVMADAFGADLLDYAGARAATGRIGRLIGRIAGDDAVLAWACFRGRKRYTTVFTDGEQIGLPYAVLASLVRRRPRHVMIGHLLSPPKKVLLHRALRLGRRIDVVVVYATAQRVIATERLGYPPSRVVLTPFMVDTAFWQTVPSARPAGARPMICAAGLELRDYPTMVEAVGGLDVDVVVAAASPWSKRDDSSSGLDIPANVTVRGYSLYDLRQLYADAAFVVVPLQETDFQAGITTILEAMSMGKAVVTSRTTGQTDTVVDGATGRYVVPGDVGDLRGAIEALLADPAEAARLGAGGRQWVVEHADIDGYAATLRALVEGRPPAVG